MHKGKPSTISAKKLQDTCLTVSRQLPPEENCPWLGLGFGSTSGLVLGLGGNQTIAPKEYCPPVRVRVWFKVSFGVGRQFSTGAIVLEPYFTGS